MVEDDPAIVKNLCEFLRGEDFNVIPASGQQAAIDLLQSEHFDLALLDISLDDGSGFTICSHIKKSLNIPVIFLTAFSDEHSVVTGLDMGADDYISKPFRPRELVSRMRSVLRRSGGDTVFVSEGLCVDTVRAVVSKHGSEVFLSALEYRLLLAFIANAGTVLTRARLLEEIWDVAGDFVNDNTLTVYIKRLRDKIEDNPQDPVIIRTVRGLGYRLGD